MVHSQLCDSKGEGSGLGHPSWVLAIFSEVTQFATVTAARKHYAMAE